MSSSEHNGFVISRIYDNPEGGISIHISSDTEFGFLDINGMEVTEELWFKDEEEK